MAEPPLAPWHEYFVMLGTASATLLGAMFVVVSIGIGFLTRDRAAQIGTFLTATVVHLSSILFGSLLTMVPGLGRAWFGGIVTTAALVGLAYSLRQVVGFTQHPGTEGSDWFWYGALPPVGYALLVAAGIGTLFGLPVSLDLFAAALAALLLAGIRNAWDMIVFLVTQPRSPD